MSSSSSISRRRLPTKCKCGFPLVKPVSWTYLNPGRRFLNCRNFNSNIRDQKKCNDFFWIDPEIHNPWYKYQMFKLYVTQNPDESVLSCVGKSVPTATSSIMGCFLATTSSLSWVISSLPWVISCRIPCSSSGSLNKSSPKWLMASSDQIH
ncbi:hypothetical protein Tco_0901326 [Tanacetum coccineum]